MALDKKVLAISKKDDKSLATGFKRAYSNGDGTYTVEFIDGSNVVTAPIKGDKGDKGDKFEFSDFTPEEIESLKVKGDQGEKGERGNGILSITKQGTAGLVDTYLILFDDGSTATYDVVNGANVTKTSQLDNDSEFITNATIGLINYYLKDEVYNKSKIDELLRNVGAGLSVKIVSSLPTEEISGTTIYLINTSGSNYNQYMYIDGDWANLGSTAVDMSSYYNKTQIDTMLLGYVNASTLLTQLMAYTKTADLGKVATSNDYNDLDNLPTIPDVSGIKPYAETLQNSNETAPTSKVVYDAVQELQEAIEGVSSIDDDVVATDSTWSSKKINDSLVDIESALEDKVDKEELNVIPLLYNQNTDILAYALTCPQAKRTLVRIHSANATNNPFGVTSDTDFIYEISKIDSADTWISVKAKDVRTNREFLNTRNDVKWLGWVELATMDNVAKIEAISMAERANWAEQTNPVSAKYVTRNDGTQGIGLYVDGTLYSIIPFAKLSL